MSQPANRAGTPIITPPLRCEDSTAAVAQANADALNEATQTALRNDGIVRLPAGTIHVADSRPVAGTPADR